MAKLNKYQRVERYLDKLMEQEELTMEGLARLHYKELVGLAEFDEIGERTISNVVKDYKQKRGILPRGEKLSKKKRVRLYLDKIVEEGKLSHQEIMELKYQDLINEKELSSIGKTTVNGILREYKKNFETTVFESKVLDFLKKENKSAKPRSEAQNVEWLKTANQNQSCRFALTDTEIDTVKKMIKSFNISRLYQKVKEEYELNELKNAMRFFGIDSRIILEQYRRTNWEITLSVAELSRRNGQENTFALESV